MILPLSSLLSTIDEALPEVLVGPRARRALQRRARSVPSAWFSGCVECRLTDGADQVDLLVCATRGAGGQHALREVLEGPGGAQAFGTARPFLREWVRPRSRLSKELAAIWLEYDLPVARPAPEPFAFVCLYPDYLEGGYPRHRPGPPLPAARVAAIASAGLAAAGARVGARPLALLRRCASALPLHGRMLHVVARPGLLGEALRIGAILPAAGLAAWLQAVGWPGEPAQLALLRRLVGARDLLHVQLELADEVSPLLSLDFESASQPRDNPGWARLVGALVELGCAQRRKATAAVRWVGSRRVKVADQPVPARVDQQLFFKLTSKPGGELQAKAYLCFHARHALL
jgi:hypothetical protein